MTTLPGDRPDDGRVPATADSTHDATDLPVPLGADALRLRRRLLIIQLVLGGLAVLAVLIVVLVGILGIGVYSHRSLGS